MNGYFKLPDWLVDNCMKEISSSDFCLLVFYCRVANSRGESWYAQSTISEITGLSIRQVGKSMRALSDAHFLVFKPKGNRTRLISLNDEMVKAIKQPKKRKEITPFNVRFSEIAMQKMLS